MTHSNNEELPTTPEAVLAGSADDGVTVTLEYTGILLDGRVFDKATPDNPFVFPVGAGQVMPAFQSAVRGMVVGETRTFAIRPEEAYGLHHEELVITVPRESFPPDERIEAGKRARVADADGNECKMIVLEVTDTGIKLDGNHPLAGQTLNYNNVTLMVVS
jgi:peptidylprolyl isomerase